MFITSFQQRSNNKFEARNFVLKNSKFVYTWRYFFFWKDALESAWRIFWWQISDEAVVCCVGLKCWHVNQHLACSKQRLACTTRLLVNENVFFWVLEVGTQNLSYRQNECDLITNISLGKSLHITQVAKRGGVHELPTFSDFFFSKKSISERLRGRRMPKIYFWKL